MQTREGDLLKTKHNVVFDVKGLVHPPRKVVAFPRFIPASSGSRRLEETAYEKVYPLLERFKFLKRKFPHYLVKDPIFDETLCEVPVDDIERYHRPAEKLRELISSKSLKGLEKLALELAEFLKENAKVPWNSVGISGSLLVRLHNSKSDIDPVFYGSKNCWKVHSVLEGTLKDAASPFKRYTREDLKALFDFRSKDTLIGFEDFVKVESRKVFQGKFMGTDYFIRFVKDWNEINEDYGDICYKNCGYAKIKATIADDSESIFTPCKYTVENVKVIEGPKLQPILEIASFRGRFCEQARKGERVIAQGKVERVINNKEGCEHLRILLGNKPSDYMALLQV
ncbi:MAG: hypothetical protein ACUVUE_02510 [Candidatus Bathycorpusculaceae bacterium]